MNIELSKFSAILRSQYDYRKLIAEFLERHNIDNLQWNEIAFFMDEVKFFWLTRLSALEIELEILTSGTFLFSFKRGSLSECFRLRAFLL